MFKARIKPTRLRVREKFPLCWQPSLAFFKCYSSADIGALPAIRTGARRAQKLQREVKNDLKEL